MNMNRNHVNSGMWYASRALFVAAAVLVVLTVTKVSGYMTSSGLVAKTVRQVKARNGSDEETVQNLMAKDRRIAEQLKKKNMFAPPPPSPKPPVCLGIIGDRAIINGKQYKAGDNVGGAEIISVGARDVVIKWEGKEITLVPFAVSNLAPPSRKPTPSSRGENKPASESGPTEVKVEDRAGSGPVMRSEGFGGYGGRGGFMGMSPEERRRMIERYRNMSEAERERFREERRRMFMREGGSFRGGGFRGGFPGGGFRGRDR